MIDVAVLRRRFLVLLAMRWFQTGLQLPVLVLLLRARDLDLTTIGVVTAVYGLTTALFELPTGGLADVVGRRPVLIAAAVLLAAESVLFAVGQTIAVLIAGAVVGGLGRALDSGPLEAWFVEAVQHDAGRPLASDLARAKTVEAGALGFGALTGGVLAALAPSTTDGVIIGLSLPFLVSAGICLLMIVAVAAWVRDIQRPTQRTTQRTKVRATVCTVPATVSTGLRLIAGQPTLRHVTVLIASVGVALATVELLTPLALAGLLGGEHDAAGPYAAVLTLGFFGSAAGSALAPTATRVLRSANRVIRTTRVLAAIALLGLASTSVAVAAAGPLAFYTLNGVTRPLVSDLTHRNVPTAQRATVLSVQSLTLQLAAVLATVVIGPVAQHISTTLAVAIGAATLAFGAIVATRSVAEPPAAAVPLQPHASDNPSQGDDYDRPRSCGRAASG